MCPEQDGVLVPEQVIITETGTILEVFSPDATIESVEEWPFWSHPFWLKDGPNVP